VSTNQHARNSTLTTPSTSFWTQPTCRHAATSFTRYVDKATCLQVNLTQKIWLLLRILAEQRNPARGNFDWA